MFWLRNKKNMSFFTLLTKGLLQISSQFRDKVTLVIWIHCVVGKNSVDPDQLASSEAS